ncbi:hypothetical protein DRP53_09035 [candidate division WOR-3 bacterium]|uniref:Outer membrane protein beta-barrel domain-containing protein n=1 Tax=candidate division WOR-3 bacterium TaxID=2052148 RepID=A0A660SEF9_UNCW3|nr:MAG: hypothetical protein DRP53_09035 [candidate division WOR-3 bacterium]
MALLLITFTIGCGGDCLLLLPRSDDLSGYDHRWTYRVGADLGFIDRHRIGFAFHPVRFDSGPFSYEGESYELYYGFDLTRTFYSGPLRLFLILGGCHHPWRLKFQGEIMQLPTGKVDFKDWGYFGGIEFNYRPIRFLDLRLGGYYYYLLSEHFDRLGFDDHDEKYVALYSGLRIRL